MARIRIVLEDVWMLEQADGSFTYLMAGMTAVGTEAVSAIQRMRWLLQKAYGAQTVLLPVVAISDGARTIRCDLEAIFGQRISLILWNQLWFPQRAVA